MLSDWLRAGLFPNISVRPCFQGGQVALLERAPSQKCHPHVSPSFVHTWGRVTLRVGSPYTCLLGYSPTEDKFLFRITLLEGSSFSFCKDKLRPQAIWKGIAPFVDFSFIQIVRGRRQTRIREKDSGRARLHLSDWLRDLRYIESYFTGLLPQLIIKERLSFI